jgi:23S rRNA (guanine745-N1)-methyltransferase
MKLFCCPICQQPLEQQGQVFRCASAHSFDLSREGYLNLLAVHQRRSANPGDDASMIASRRHFLDAGHYSPLVDALTSVLSAHRISSLVDLGCGEGFFSNAALYSVPLVYGIDISKPAIRSAAKRYRSLNLAIANVMHLPLPTATFDAAMIILAPFTEDVVRVLHRQGTLLRVSPGADHLVQIKDRVYDDSRPHQRANLELPFLRHTGQAEIRFDMLLDGNSRGDLVAMTPMQHRIHSSHRDQITRDEDMQVTADFWIDTFESNTA